MTVISGGTSIRRIPVFLLSLVAVSVSLHALPRERSPEDRIPETADVRTYMREEVLAPKQEVLERPREQVFRQNVSDTRVKYEVRAGDEHFYLLFLNEVPASDRNDGYPVFGAGNYIVRRNMDDGSFSQIKVFLQTDPGFFARLFPDGDRVRMEIHAAGERLYSNIALSTSFERLLFAPFSTVIEMTDSIVDWEYLLPEVDPARYEEVRTMAERARDALSSLPDAEDGAMDENGKLVSIESLVLQDDQPGFNCSGFAKWIVDGIVEPRTGEYLGIDRLKQKHLDARGHRWSARREEERDPYFGLDWSRNLAAALLELDRPGSDIDPEAADVRRVPYARYVEDVGYPVGELRRVLYGLALEEPGHFYIGSVNQEFGTEPVLRQHVHIAVFFPYFDESGRFRVTLLERNVESTLDSLADRYAGAYVHLVRARADERFTPPAIE
ncbi:MAG: hypothetical protein ACLFUX_05285 [Spirochaetaceae bacterium]